MYGLGCGNSEKEVKDNCDFYQAGGQTASFTKEQQAEVCGSRGQEADGQFWTL